MKSFLYPKINPPSFTWVNLESGVVSKVHEWIQPSTAWNVERSKEAEVVILGVPLSRSSISASGASEFPEAFRRSWRSFATYNLDEDVDLAEMTALDVGDVPMHVTDIRKCHDNIIQASELVHSHFKGSKVCAIGALTPSPR